VRERLQAPRPAHRGQPARAQAHSDPWLGWTELEGVGFVVAERSPYEADLDWARSPRPDEICRGARAARPGHRRRCTASPTSTTTRRRWCLSRWRTRSSPSSAAARTSWWSS
jgi:hypothetical protein